MDKLVSYTPQSIEKVFSLLNKLNVSGVESAHCIVAITQILSAPDKNSVTKEESKESEKSEGLKFK